MKKDPKSLSIRAKVIISVLILTSILTLIFYFITTKIILKSYSTVENDVVETNIKRVNFAIQNIENNQSVKLKDWAVWDDTYQFVKDLNKEYSDSNLQVSSLVNLDVNFMAFTNNDGNIIFNKVIDLEEKEELKGDEITSVLNNYNKILKQTTLDGKISGMIRTPYGIAFVSSGPILTSDGTGPINGSLILGNFLSKDVTKKIGDSILYPVDIVDYNSNLSEDFLDAQNSLSDNNKGFIKILSDKNVAGYSLVYDLESKPIAISRIILPRDFYNKGVDTFNLFTIITGVMYLLFGLGIIFVLEKLIIRRFTVLNKEFTDINTSKDLTKRVTVDNDDEIGNLSLIINNTFNELNLAQEKERESQNLEKTATEDLKRHMEETEKLNKLMVNRELKMIELKKKVEELEKK